jgi:hypothetical protein
LVLLTSLLLALGPAFAQEKGQKAAEPAEKKAHEKAPTPDKASSKPELPFQIQLLESHIRFENNGDSRKEVHTIVKINNILGASQFARLTFDYNRAFQQVEIPLVRISHANGGTSELLPSAVVDAPNPAVEKFPAYQDVRVKSVRVLGLQEGDTIEYRVITTTTKHPLAPDFWLEHTFDRSGQVLEERYEVDLPGARNPQVRIGPALAPAQISKSGEAENARVVYRWSQINKEREVPTNTPDPKQPDLIVTSFDGWQVLSVRLAGLLQPEASSEDGWLIDKKITEKAQELTRGTSSGVGKLEAIYDFVSREIRTVDLSIGATGFHTREETEILATGYATAEDKYRLFAALARPYGEAAEAFLLGASGEYWTELPRPSPFDHLLIKEKYDTGCANCENPTYWLDPSLEVAPFGMMLANLRGQPAFWLDNRHHGDLAILRWDYVPPKLPFSSFQRVNVAASLSSEGGLSSKVKYALRGDNELLLRVAFHQTPKERWKDVAGLLAISDGFRGQVTSVNVSDPMETKDPFTVEYEITQAKFVDWSKKPVRIPALLPQIGLPDPPAKTAAGEAAHAIELGTPLDVDTQMTLQLPPGVRVEAPAGTSVERDYSTFSSKYSAAANTVTASRRVNFLLREIPGDRAMDYNAFVRAVQNDQAQMITLVGAVVPADVAKPTRTAPK